MQQTNYRYNAYIYEMIIPKRGMKRQYVYGGSGIIETIASTIARIAGRSASEIGKQVVSQAVIPTAKAAADAVGKKVGEKVVNKIASSVQGPEKRILEKSGNLVQKYTTGNGLEDQHKAIAIQDLVKRLNGSGLKIV